VGVNHGKGVASEKLNGGETPHEEYLYIYME